MLGCTNVYSNLAILLHSCTGSSSADEPQACLVLAAVLNLVWHFERIGWMQSKAGCCWHDWFVEPGNRRTRGRLR